MDCRRRKEQERGITNDIYRAYMRNLGIDNWVDIDLADHAPASVDFNRGGTPPRACWTGQWAYFCAVAGVDPQPAALASPSALKFPLAFINRIDRTGANFEAVPESMRARLMAKSRAACRSAWPGEDFRAVLDLFIGHEACFDPADQGPDNYKNAPSLQKKIKLPRPGVNSFWKNWPEADDVFPGKMAEGQP